MSETEIVARYQVMRYYSGPKQILIPEHVLLILLVLVVVNFAV